MVKVLENISFFGGLLVAVLGVIMILVTNDTGQEQVLLRNIMVGLIFFFGSTIFFMLIVRSKSNKK